MRKTLKRVFDVSIVCCIHQIQFVLEMNHPDSSMFAPLGVHINFMFFLL